MNEELKLSDREWRGFSLGDIRIFDLKATANGIDKVKLNMSGTKETPYITRSDKQNGIADFIPTQEKSVNNGNVITIGLDTQTVFYQPKAFYTGQNVQILSCEKMSRNIAMFLMPLIKKQLATLNWGGNGATLGRLKAKKILLPVTPQSLTLATNALNSGATGAESDTLLEPDWEFMERYIHTHTHNHVKSSIKLPKPHKITDNRELGDVEWGEFRVSEVFEMKTGGTISQYKFTQGKQPRITATDTTNGIGLFAKPIDDKNMRVVDNVITYSFLGSSFYQGYECSLDMKIHSLKPKTTELDKYIGNFIARCLSNSIPTPSYGNQVSSKDLLKKTVKLPTTPSHTPDFVFMKQYMKRMENKVLERVVGNV